MIKVWSVLLLFSLILISCHEQEKKTSFHIMSKEECLTGKWQLMDGGFLKTFQFNPDMTGIETYSETEKFGFTWSIMNEHPRLIYNHNHDTLFLDLNCIDSLIVVNGFKYHKKAAAQ